MMGQRKVTQSFARIAGIVTALPAPSTIADFVQPAAHNLKSSSANRGATTLAVSCQELKLGARQQCIMLAEAQPRAPKGDYQETRIAVETELQGTV